MENGSQISKRILVPIWGRNGQFSEFVVEFLIGYLRIEVIGSLTYALCDGSWVKSPKSHALRFNSFVYPECPYVN